MKLAVFGGLTMLGLSAMLLTGGTALADDGALNRLAADYQNNTTVGPAGEIATNKTPISGGKLVYSKKLSIPFDVVYITFSAQGDAHFGSALLMQASIADESGKTTICQPLAGQTDIGGGPPPSSPVTHVFPNWYTLLHLPQATTGTNCNDGAGGTADCHDSTIMFSCCARIEPDSPFVGDDFHTVNIRLADLPGFTPGPPPSGSVDNVAFYERSTIYIDASSDPKKNLCQGHGVP